MESLPDEVLLEIFSYLPVEDLVNSVPQVCSLWATLSSDYEAWLNKKYIVGKYGGKRNDLQLATALSIIPGGPRNMVIFRNVDHKVIDSIGGSCVQSLFFCNNQNMYIQTLEALLSRCPNIIQLQLPARIVILPETWTVLANNLARKLRKFAIRSSHSTLHTIELPAQPFPHLHELDLEDVICNLDRLRDLLLSCTKLRKLALSAFAEKGESIVDSVLPHYGTLEKLKFNFHDTQIGTSLYLPQQLIHLQELILENVHETDIQGITSAFKGTGLRELRSVALRNFPAFSGALLTALLSGRPKLRRLDLTRSLLDDKAIMEGMGATQPTKLLLTELILTSCSKLNGLCLKDIVNCCPELRELCLLNVKIHGYRLHTIRSLNHLKEVTLSQNKNLHQWWYPLLKLRTLERVELHKMKLKYMSLEQFVHRQANLKYLKLWRCRGFDERWNPKLRKLNPHLVIENIG